MLFINPEKLPKIYELLEKFESAMVQNPRNSSFIKDHSIQCTYNIPILLLTALYIGQYCNNNNVKRVLFSSRDCFYLEKIFSILFDNQIESRYFFTSRISRIQPTEVYKKYCSTLIHDQTLIVDLCGTGISLGCLYKSLEIQPKTFFLHLIEQSEQESNATLKKLNGVAIKNSSYLIKGKIFNNIYIEIANYSNNGMLLDMKYLGAKKQFFPIFKAPKFPNNVALRIGNFQYLFDLFLKEVKLLDINDLIKEQDSNSRHVENTILNLYKDLTMQESIFSDFFYYHFQELKDVEKLITKKWVSH